MCIQVCSVHVHGVCVCVHAHFIFSFVSPIAYSTVDIYVLNTTVRRIWISVNCRGLFCLLEQKKAKWEVFIKMFNYDISGHLPLKIDANPTVTFSFFFSSQWVLLRWCFILGLTYLINSVIALWKDLDTNNKWVKHHSLQYLAKIN